MRWPSGENKIVMFGGDNGGWDKTIYLRSTWIYDSSTQKWSEHNTSGIRPEARIHHVMAYAGNSKVILYGGFKGSRMIDTQLNDTWLYDVSNNTWTQVNLSGTNPGNSVCDAATYMGDNQILLYKGMTQESWILDTTTYEWTKL